MNNEKTLKQLHTEFVTEYLPVELGRSQATIKSYSLLVQKFLDFIQAELPKDITLIQVSDFRKHLTDKGVKPQTINNYLIALKAFLKFIKKRDYNILDPEQITLANVPDGNNIEFLSPEEVTRLLEAPKKLRDKAILSLAFASGLRVSELVNLNRDSVNLEICEVKVVNGKGGKSAVVFFTPNTREILQEYLHTRTDSNEALFVSMRNGQAKRLTPRAVQLLVSKYSHKAGIRSHTTPHSLRRAYACHLLKQGASVFYVQKLLRHKSIQSTQHYLSSTNAELKEVYEQYTGLLAHC